MVNDISIATGIITFFILLGAAIPFINDDFGLTDTTTVNIDGFISEIGQEADTVSSINAFDIILSMFKMFFWTFGDLPFIIDTLLIIPRVILVLLLARNIWVGGGA